MNTLRNMKSKTLVEEIIELYIFRNIPLYMYFDLQSKSAFKNSNLFRSRDGIVSSVSFRGVIVIF